jgi:hypothetical protein
MIRYLKNKLFCFLQKVTLHLTWSFYRQFPFLVGSKCKWTVGTCEIAAFLKNITGSLDGAVSVCLTHNVFYQDTQYDYAANPSRFLLLRKLHTAFYGPFLLGYLLNNADGFIFLWSSGFLAINDGREYEFNFIKKRGKKIVCFFLGNDSRSVVKEKEMGAKLDLDVAANYYKYVYPHFSSPQYDLEKIRIARVAQKHADFIFNADVDQSSYLTNKSLPFMYFFPDNKIRSDFKKFNDKSNPLIIHAPSSAIIKGTQLVRAAIKKLRNNGYLFRYIELEGVPNSVVLEKLEEAHIVLNEFYMFTPGMFGIEAMANCCVLITAADEFIEKSLPEGSNKAWISTKYFEVYDNLKKLLDSPSSWEEISRAGNEWVRIHAASSSSGKKFQNIISN